MYELNIDTWCANSSSAKGCVERAHLTLQDRVAKELRLRGISTIDAANAYTPASIASYNARFAKPPKSAFDVHRPLRDDEDLDANRARRSSSKFTQADVDGVIVQLALQHVQTHKPPRKPRQRSAGISLNGPKRPAGSRAALQSYVRFKPLKDGSGDLTCARIEPRPPNAL